MEYRNVGRSGLKVSSIGLGSWLTYAGYAEESARACIERAYDLGITFFDTANVYHHGAAEAVVGRVLGAYPRDSYVLATKVFFPMGDKPTQRGLSRKHIMDQCHASLRRLGTDYIDLYQTHRYDPQTPVEETLRALDDLIRQGKILYAGVSEWSPSQIRTALDLADRRGFDRIISNQPIYNMFVRYIEAEILPLCRQEGIGQVVFSPLGQGVLSGKYRSADDLPAGARATRTDANQWVRSYLVPEVLEATRVLEGIAAEHGWSLPQLALAWVLRDPAVASAITGASRPEQVTQNAAAAEIRLDEATLEAVEKALAPTAGVPIAW